MALLKDEFPQIYAQLHPTMNSMISVGDLKSKSHKECWWICTTDANFTHYFQQTVANMTKHKTFRCGVCCSAGGIRPDLISHWNYEKYVKQPNDCGLPINTLFDKGIRSKKAKYYWKCPKGHIEPKPISIAAMGQRKNKCKRCESILYTHPEVAKYYSKKNLTNILDISSGMRKSVLWTCDKGHEDDFAVNQRVRDGVGCRICSGKIIVSGVNSLADLNPELMVSWDWRRNDAIGISPYEIGPGYSTRKVYWKCEKHSSYPATVANRNHNSSPTGCPNCKPQSSRNEIRIFSELQLLLENVQHRKKVNGSEIDIYLPDQKIGIQFDGWYWHQDSISKDTLQHVQLKTLGIDLIRVREQPLERTSMADIFIEKNSVLTHDDISKIVGRILSLRSNEIDSFTHRKIKSYVDSGVFGATDEYEKITLNSFNVLEQNSLQAVFPEIAGEWDFELNAPVTPSMITPGVGGDVNGNNYYWKCLKNLGHDSYQMPVYSRTGVERQGCPQCAGRKPTTGRNLQVIYPALAEMFDQAENHIDGEQVWSHQIAPNSGLKYNWVCDEGHKIFDKSPDQMSKAKYFNGCDICYEAARKNGTIKVGNHRHNHARIIELYSRLNNLTEVAKIVGCSPTTVSNVLKRSNTKINE